MRRLLALLAALALIIVLRVPTAHAVDTSPCPSPSPSPGAASDARISSPSPSPSTIGCPPVNPNEALYAQLEARLGTDLATALAAQDKVNAALDQTALTESVLSDQISQQETRISDLQDHIAQLDSQIADTQSRIDVERAQVAAMAVAIYRQPDSLWMLIARTGNLHQALLATADLVVASQRAHALQAQLQADLVKLQADRAARQADLDRQNAALDQLNASLTAMDDVMARQDDLISRFDDLMGQIQDAQAALRDQPPDVTAGLAHLIEQAEQNLVQLSNNQAWAEAQVGAGLAMIIHALPPGKGPVGLHLSWPMPGAHITQPFGPSDVVLEPPYGGYAHFHTGIDLAMPLGTPVLAAADGVVVAAANTKVGYGNYVIVAHGGGVMTLYAHLLVSSVVVGDKVARGHRVGLEGSTGLSTGPHLHFEVRVNDEVVDPMTYLPALPASS